MSLSAHEIETIEHLTALMRATLGLAPSDFHAAHFIGADIPTLHFLKSVVPAHRNETTTEGGSQ